MPQKMHLCITVDSYIANIARIRPDINVSQICERALQTFIELPENINIDITLLEDEKQDLMIQKRKIENSLVEIDVKIEKVKQQLEAEQKDRDLQSDVRHQVYKNMDLVNKLVAGEKIVMDTQK